MARVKAAGRQVLAVNPAVAGNGVARQPKVVKTAEPGDKATKGFVPAPPTDNHTNGSKGEQERAGS